MNRQDHGCMFAHSGLPRRGNAPEEYEDAFDDVPAAGRFAVADGATEVAFRTVMGTSVGRGLRAANGRRTTVLDGASAHYARAMGGRSGEGTAALVRQRKYRRGAFATFLGLTVFGTGDGAIACAVAIGDACLLHTRTKELLSAFPLARVGISSDNYPNLVGSRAAVKHVRQNLSVHAGGDALPDDRLWLMTDAFAQCCLVRHETGDELWEILESLRLSSDGDAEFGRWVETMRDDGSLHNDDVTLLAIEV